MARLKGKIIKGLVNGMVYREYRGEQIIQSAPKIREKNRTEGTKKAATVFGKASKLAAEIRVGLHHFTHRDYDGKMPYRLSAEILHILNIARDRETETFNFKEDSFRSLVGFEFNLNSPLKTNLLVNANVTLNGTTLNVEIPDLKIPIDLKFPEDRLACCRIAVACTMLDLVNRRTLWAKPQVMEVPYSYESKLMAGQTFSMEVVRGSLCIIAISLQYVNSSFAGDIIINSKLFNPTAIIYSSFIGGTLEKSATENWKLHSYLSHGLQ